MYKPKFVRSFFLLFALVVFLLSEAIPVGNSAAVVRIRVKEGNDYATRVLRDPWDMSNFSDISQNLNDQGRNTTLKNIMVKDGIFSATSPSAAEPLNAWAHFFTPAPGLWYEMLAGKIGYRYPIQSSVYQCVHVRQRVTNSTNPYWLVGWQRLIHDGQGNYQKEEGNYSAWLPEGARNGFPVGTWTLLSVNLSTTAATAIKWTDRAEWHGIEIHPLNTPNSNFEVDWVRLTDCKPVEVDLSWTAQAGQTRLWAGINALSKDFLIDTLQPGQISKRWDVQGLPPGIYKVSVETNGVLTSVNQEVEVVPAPVVEFTNPAPWRGQDYAASQGNPWDMDPSDIPRISCAEYRFENGIFKMDTQHPGTLPQGCAGFSVYREADPKLFLNTPAPFNTADYRYLTFRMYMSGDIQRVADGMIGRLIWHEDSTGCDQVSKGIPFDVGWHTYVIDLHDPENGMPAEGCQINTRKWKDSGRVTSLRFDPNENFTGVLPGVPAVVFHQEFDWIRLTKLVEVKKGVKFPIGANFNKPRQDVRVTYYYTTTPSIPEQNLAVVEPLVTNPVPPGPMRMYIPILMNKLDEIGFETAGFWNTASVDPGTYYLCAVASDVTLPTNTGTYCSDSPLKVLP